MQRRSPLPIIEMQKPHWNVSGVDRRETGLFPGKMTSLSGNPVKLILGAISLSKSVSQVFAHRHSMGRSVSKRSSSSFDLAASALDDVRAERAAIALCVGLSWSPDRYTKTPGRPSWQQLWERALQDHILNHHELPQGIRLQRPAWWRPGETIDWPLKHVELAYISTPRAAAAAAAAPAAVLVEDEPSGRASPQDPR